MKSSTNNNTVPIPRISPLGNSNKSGLSTLWPALLAFSIMVLAVTLYLLLPDNDNEKPVSHGSLPVELTANLTQGTLFFEQGELDKAAALYQKMIDDYPSYPHGYNNLAALYAFRGELDKARVLLEKAISTDINFAAIYGNLGKIYGELARDSYVRALQLDARDQKAHLLILDAQGTAQLEAKDKVTVAATQSPVQAVASTTSESIISTQTPHTSQEPIVGTAETAETSVSVAASEPQPATIDESPEDFLMRWAAAWSAQDADSYFDFYADDYVPRNHKSRADWEKKRRSRIIRPEFIVITIEQIKTLTLSDTTAEIELVQSYKNNRFQDKTRKRFELVRSDNSWLIISEHSLGSLR